MSYKTRLLFGFACFAAAAGQPAGEDRLAAFQQQVRQDMTNIPNYTCLETIERTHREPHSRNFKPIDTVRLEVSMVGGKELFAWPGSRQFEDRPVTAMVTGGAIGSGLFATFAHNLFVAGKGALQYAGEEKLEGRNAVRYDFHLTWQESGLRVTTAFGSEEVAAKGSFWFDPVSLDLIHLDVFGDAMPYSLRLEETVFRTDYARTQIGEAKVLLPKRTDLVMAHFSGEASRDVIDFSRCRAYRTESTISFDAPAAVAETPKAATRIVDLPAGLSIPVEFRGGIDSKTASIGDRLQGRVVAEVRLEGNVFVPAGARVTAYLRQLTRGNARTPSGVGIELSEIEWEGGRAQFHAEMADVDRKSAGSHKPVMYFDGHVNRVLIDTGNRKAGGSFGIFYVPGERVQIPPGLRMVWQTLAR